MKKTQWQLMELITIVTSLHIGCIGARKRKTSFFVVLNSNPNKRFKVWVGVMCWMAKLFCLAGLLLFTLAVPFALLDGRGIIYAIGCLTIATICGKTAKIFDGLFQKRPSWNKESYYPTCEELADWNNWVHCEEEYINFRH